MLYPISYSADAITQSINNIISMQLLYLQQRFFIFLYTLMIIAAVVICKMVMNYFDSFKNLPPLCSLTYFEIVKILINDKGLEKVSLW